MKTLELCRAPEPEGQRSIPYSHIPSFLFPRLIVLCWILTVLCWLFFGVYFFMAKYDFSPPESWVSSYLKNKKTKKNFLKYRLKIELPSKMKIIREWDKIWKPIYSFPVLQETHVQLLKAFRKTHTTTAWVQFFLVMNLLQPNQS